MRNSRQINTNYELLQAKAENLKQIRADYEYLRGEYGCSYDFCGATCDCNILFDLLSGKITRFQAYKHLIEAYWELGCDNTVRKGKIPTDKRAMIIKDRYGID